MNIPHLAPHRERRVRHLTGLLVGGAIVATLSFGVPALTAASGDAAEGAATTITTAAGTSTSSSSSTTSAPETTTTTTPPLSPEEQLLANIQALSPEGAAAFVRYTSPPPPPPTTTTTAPKPKVTAPPAPKPAPAPAPQVSSGGAPGGFLACVRQRESRGNYSINTGNGYYGAYQFSQTTWNNTANHAGRGDLVGVPPSSASPADQDAMAQHLLSWQGTSPWAGPGC